MHPRMAGNARGQVNLKATYATLHRFEIALFDCTHFRRRHRFFYCPNSPDLAPKQTQQASESYFLTRTQMTTTVSFPSSLKHLLYLHPIAAMIL